MAEYLRGYSWQRYMLISGSAVLIFAFIGPFGTFNNLSFFARLVFWAIAGFGCGAFFWVAAFLFNHISAIKNTPAFLYHSMLVFLLHFRVHY